MTELQIVSQIQQFIIGSSASTALAIFTARYFIAVFFVLAAFLWYSTSKRERHAAVEAVWAVLFALLITNLIGVFVGRLRPFQMPILPGFPIELLIPAPITSSFPSGHTATSMALAAAVFWGDRRLGILAFLAAALIGFSRILVGVHYLSDVLAGALVGLAAFALIRYIHRALKLRI